MLLSLSIWNSLNSDKKQEPEVVLYLNKLFFQEKSTQSSNTCVVNQNVVITYSQGDLRAMPEQNCVVTFFKAPLLQLQSDPVLQQLWLNPMVVKVKKVNTCPLSINVHNIISVIAPQRTYFLTHKICHKFCIYVCIGYVIGAGLYCESQYLQQPVIHVCCLQSVQYCVICT